MRSDRTERLLNLVLCLLDSKRPVHRAAIRTAVPGYADSASDEGFERMFERDKDELRAMGVPVETVLSAAGDVEGYRIPSDEYSLPPVSFSAEELAVVGLAARAWSDAVIAGAARGALRKIEAASGSQASPDGPGISLAVRPGAGDYALPVLWEGIRSRRVVTFSYRGLRDDSASPRSVEPWGTARVRGAWYLAGHDRDRQDTRVFRLSRIAGDVALNGSPGAFPAVDSESVRVIIERLAEVEPSRVAEVSVESGGARLRMRADDPGAAVLRIPFSDVSQLVSDIAELGSRARVIAPDDLREAVSRSLADVLTAHGDAP